MPDHPSPIPPATDLVAQLQAAAHRDHERASALAGAATGDDRLTGRRDELERSALVLAALAELLEHARYTSTAAHTMHETIAALGPTVERLASGGLAGLLRGGLG